MVHEDHLPYHHVMGPSRLHKALTTLQGILTGILADGVIDAAELVFLQRWVDEHDAFSGRAPFGDILSAIEMALEDGVLDDEEVAGILDLIARLTPGSEYFDAITADMQSLQGLLGGIAADGIVSMEELDALAQWMQEREYLHTVWPYDELESLILEVQRDKRIDEREQEMLQRFFSEFTATSEHRALSQLVVDLVDPPIGLCAVCPEITFEGRIFCITGSSKRARRREIEEVITSLGGVFRRGMSADTNFLVVCDDGNPCWAYSCYGRKVEAAMALRKRGGRMLIVHESDFWDAVEDAGADMA